MQRPVLKTQPNAPPRAGLDFASRDCLALASHPALRDASFAGLGQRRHDPMAGPIGPVTELEIRLAKFLQLPTAVAFATGTDAIRCTISAILRRGDQVIVDAGVHPAVAGTVLSVQARLHRAPPASVDGVERRLARLARQPREGRLFIVVPAVSALASRIADLSELASLARSYGATLIVDASQDLGTMGQDGGGVAEIQGCGQRIDVLLGSLAGTFGARGGFAAFRDPELRDMLLSGPVTSPALSPVNASVILAAIDLVASAEGRRRRRNLHGLSLRLRNHLMADDIKVLGSASPFVPILLPHDTALPRTALLESAGPRIQLLRTPDVPLHAPRWRIALSAAHGPADIDDLAELLRDVTRAFDRVPSVSRVLA